MELIPIAFYALRWVHEGIHALLLRLLGAHVTWRRRGRIWPDTDAPDAPRAKRIVGALLTPAVLYLAGVALPAAVLLALLGGRPVSTATVESVRPDMPGEAAGLRAGDEVVAVGDVRTPDGDTLRGELGRYPDRSVTLRIRRAGAHLTLQATPRRTPDGAALGVVLGSRVERPGVIEALQQGVTIPLMIVAAQVVAV